MPSHDTKRSRFLAISVVLVSLLAGGVVAIAAAGVNNHSTAAATAEGFLAGPSAPTTSVPPPITVPAGQVTGTLDWTVAELRVSFDQVSFLVVHTDHKRTSWTCVASGDRALTRTTRVSVTVSHRTDATPVLANEWLEGFSVVAGAPIGESVQLSSGSSFLTCPDGSWTVLHGSNGPSMTEADERTTTVYVSANGGNRWSVLSQPG
jgi:hypothetical protein